FEWIEERWPEARVRVGTGFDAVMLLETFGHFCSVQRRAEALRACADALRDGGVIVLDVLNLKDSNEWGPMLETLHDRHHLAERGYERGEVFYKRVGREGLSYYRYFASDELKALLGATGFDVVELQYIGYGRKYGSAVSESEGAI